MHDARTDIIHTVQLVCSLVSFFNLHVSTRTFSNSAETALTAAAMACWPWQEGDRSSADARKGSKVFSYHYTSSQ